MSICESYVGIYVGVPLSLRSTVPSAANCLRRQGMLDSALPELYAAIIVFAVKTRVYFEARGTYRCQRCTIYEIHAKPKLGIKKFASTLKSFDIEFQPFIEEINAKEGVIRECADAATMERIRGMLLYIVWGTIEQDLTQAYRHRRCPSGYYIRTETFGHVKWLADTLLFLIVNEGF